MSDTLWLAMLDRYDPLPYLLVKSELRLRQDCLSLSLGVTLGACTPGGIDGSNRYHVTNNQSPIPVR
jgi:hypothetical protein